MNYQHQGNCKKHRPKFQSMWVSQRISPECSCWIPQLHRVWYSQCFCWLREDKTTDADDEKQRLRWNACIIWKWDRDGLFINQLAQQICMAYARLEREGLWQQYKISDVLPKQSKDSLQKTPPCEDVLQLHILRANHQVFIWQQSLLAQQAKNHPLQHGWCLDEEHCFDIKWMTCTLVPDEVTAFILKLSIKNNYCKNDNSAAIDWQIWSDDSYSKDY